jgi:NADH-quinone oxidoreductase subunit M
MSAFPILSLLILIPFIGSLLIASGKMGDWVKKTTIFISALQLALIVFVYFIYDFSNSSFQLSESHQWIHLDLGNFGKFHVNYALGIDGLSLGLIILTGFISFIAIINSHVIKEKLNGYFSLVLLLNASIIGCFLSKDLLLFYVFFEFMLLPMYFLIGIWGGPRKNYASLKFFIYTLVGSLFILVVMLGLGIAYVDPYETAINIGMISDGQNFDISGLTAIQNAIANQEIPTQQIIHSFDIQALSDPKNCQIGSILHPDSGWVLANYSARYWSFWLLFIGFAIKLPLVPFHTWLPDAHVDAPTPISVILAGILLKIGAYGWLRICFPFFPREAVQNADILAALGAFSIIYGAYNALAMSDLKKLVAYSSISHMGFVLIGIASFNAEGVQGAIFQSLSHGILSSLLFLMVGVIYDRTGNRNIDSFRGLANQMPKFTLISGIAIFASLGLPGFSGFIGEFFSLMGGFTSQYILAVWAIIGAFGILLGAGYLLWTFQKIYLGKFYLKNMKWEMNDLTKLELVSLYSLGILSILLGIYPDFIFRISESFALNFVRIFE